MTALYTHEGISLTLEYSTRVDSYLPVISGVVALGFPTVHPSTSINEATGAMERRSRVDHVGGRCEEFIGDMDNGGTSSSAGQVYKNEKSNNIV
jgi:hypothetical protein